MNPSLRADIIGRLTRDMDAVENGAYLQRVTCPGCGKREAYISTDKPWMLKCGRENNCGDQHHVKELFPELFESWTERYADLPPPPGKPKSTTPVADGYLTDGRGFELERIQGWYTQETYWSHKHSAGSTTVRFALPGGAYWERILDKPERFGKQKANFVGRYKGQWWQPPTLTDADLAESDEIWIVEGIFDAIALLHHGIAAVSAMSCSNYPDAALKRVADAAHAAGHGWPTLVWALDSNRAGQNGTLKHVERARAAGWDCQAAQIPGKQDWNDQHQADRLSQKHLQTYRYHGALLLAESPTAKALLIYKRTERREFWFEYKHQVWWFKLSQEAFERAVRSATGSADPEDMQLLDEQQRDAALQQAGTVSRICTCLPEFLYYQANAITDESWYYARVDFPSGKASIKNTFSGGQLASASEFKKRLMGVAAGALWTGTSQQLDSLLQDQISNIKTVETIDYIGYSREHGAYVFGDLAVSDGTLYPINSEDYFELKKLQLKTLSQSVTLAINPKRDEYRRDWANNLYGAFGARGVVALAWWLGSLFAEQIRQRQKSYPFLEVIGEAGAGKSTLIEFFWKLCGRQDYEGFDPAKATMPARARNFAQVSNLPVVLIESDREQEGGAKQRQFDWDELKTAYNGRSIRARGVKNSGNDTYEPPFRGAILISQNAAVQAGEAIQTRITHLHFTREGQNAQTKKMAEALERVPMEDVSGFLLEATLRERSLLALMERGIEDYESNLIDDEGVHNLRIAKCHAQLLGLLDCLGPDGLDLFNEQIIDQAAGHIWQMARERQQAINADHPMVAEFWEAFDYIEGLRADPTLNHYGDGTGQIAVNLKDFERMCGEHKLRVPDIRELKRHLKTSKSRKFVDSNRTVRSQVRLGNASVKCWIFRDE
ncbi:Toprim-like [Modicisalibacter ilicicola DSM 19980]|uniref:Toprim-like n=1 Tax=Modicisalibacter ilicicola DSM 19980 TaxID=1121942 RepID=A0A1M4Y1K1_9GAMM|nr:toprim domain-containing protein [Halomonas ilicicola]SHE99717.1 Toprim-like [Halomonas ilicicola DSM 19980]